ncbi:MAG: YHS domain-containing protein [Nitrososphaerota archaeon]|nr:YHS domain-containing protein [Nitrososphaerota archaeon]MDG7023753.1 YHS domain-containing protein [Nitrososphaerota archaeon]
MQRDLVCGMEIDETETEFRATYAGVSYYFCSTECLETFKRLAKVFSKDAVELMSPIRFMES